MITCKRCGCIGHFQGVLLEDGPHHGKYVCKECGTFAGWMPKPTNETKRKKNKYSADDLGINYCQMCLRPKSRLGSRETLEPHHIKEIQHGGDDIPENIWVVCSYCHKVIHQRRIYLNDHYKGYVTPGEFEALMEKDNVPESVRESMRKLFNTVRDEQSRAYKTAA